MTSRSFVPLACLAVFGFQLSVLAADETMETMGRPKQFEGGKPATYALWYEDGLWRLRCTCPPPKQKGNPMYFTGWVRVEGDKVIGNFQGLEKAKNPKWADYIKPSSDQKSFEFKFAVVGGVDGVDFKGGDKAERITFRLLTGGDDDPKKILIGPRGAHPSKAEFTLPARPTK
jgi:hypothetical protein